MSCSDRFLLSSSPANPVEQKNQAWCQTWAFTATQNLWRWGEECAVFLLTSAVTLLTVLCWRVAQGFTRFLCPGGWSGLLWHLHASVGPAGSRWTQPENDNIQDICWKYLCHWIILKATTGFSRPRFHDWRFTLLGLARATAVLPWWRWWQHVCAQLSRMVAVTEEVAPWPGKFSLAASSHLRLNWPAGCLLHYSAAKPQQDSFGLTHRCTVSNVCVTVHVTSLSRILWFAQLKRIHAEARLEERGRRIAEWTVTSLLVSSRLIQDGTKDPHEGSFSEMPPWPFTLFSFHFNIVKIYWKAKTKFDIISQHLPSRLSGTMMFMV